MLHYKIIMHVLNICVESFPIKSIALITNWMRLNFPKEMMKFKTNDEL